MDVGGGPEVRRGARVPAVRHLGDGSDTSSPPQSTAMPRRRSSSSTDSASPGPWLRQGRQFADHPLHLDACEARGVRRTNQPLASSMLPTAIAVRHHSAASRS